VGGAPRDEGEHRDDEPGDSAAGLDAEKKTLRASERDEASRREWIERAKGLDVRGLIFVDEFGSNIGMGRAYARAPKGRRAHDSAPRNRGRNTTVIASLKFGGMGECLELEGSADAEAMAVYMERVLGPTLGPGDTVVMDNLSAHKDGRVIAAIEARGASALFLPAYSPDLNPIEEAFSKIKGVLRSAAARTREALGAAIREALAAVTPDDALGYFAAAGYLPRINTCV
jgi:transposase